MLELIPTCIDEIASIGSNSFRCRLIIQIDIVTLARNDSNRNPVARLQVIASLERPFRIFFPFNSFEYGIQKVYNYSKQVELKRILQILLRRKWIAIQAFLVIFLTAVIGSFLLKPIYETSAKLWFKPPTVTPSLLASIGMKEITSFVPSGAKEVDIGTKLTLTKVYPLLEKVIYRLQVRDDEGNLLSPDKLIKSSLLYMIFLLLLFLSAQDTDSNTITITARSSDPHQAMFISNTLAEVYIEDSETREEKRDSECPFILLKGRS